MNIRIPSDFISSHSLSILFSKIVSFVKSGEGKISVPDLLSILNFPIDVQMKIRKARGPLEAKCNGLICKASNKGKKVEENIPGSGGTVGIILHEDFSCEFKLGSFGRSIVIGKIKGLTANIAGPFNPDVDQIRIILPDFVDLEI